MYWLKYWLNRLERAWRTAEHRHVRISSLKCPVCHGPEQPACATHSLDRAALNIWPLTPHDPRPAGCIIGSAGQ
jgi:hypothetical protein